MVRVGVDHDFDAVLLGHAQMHVAQVEAVGIGIQLHGDFVFRGRLENGVDVEWVGVAAQQLAAGGMADDRGVGIRNRLEQAVGHGGAILVEVRVHAGNHDVHLGEHGVGEVERAVGEDVDLDAGEDANGLRLLVFVQRFLGGANPLDVREGALVGQAVGESEVLRVIGDRHVGVAASARRLGHFFDGVAAVGLNGVHVHVAAQVAEFEQRGQFVFRGCLDFA